VISLSGISTADGLSLMWVVPNENKLVIYKNGGFHEIVGPYYDDVGVPPEYKARSIIALNETTTLFA